MKSEDRIRYLRQIKKDTRSRKPISIEAYNENTVVKDYTNCMAYALGTTCTSSELFRPGIISGQKSKKEDFISELELKNLFIADCNYLNLSVTPFGDKGEDLLRYAKEFQFRTTEYMIGLFALKYADQRIRGFHFVRYDSGYGWSEKMDFGGYARKMDSLIYLDKWEYSFCSGFIVHKSLRSDILPWEDHIRNMSED